MAENVSISYASSRQADQLSDGDQARFRQLTRQRSRTPAEQYELGALRARARTTLAGRRLLDDIGHDQAGRRQRPVTTRQAGSLIAQTVADAIAKRLAEED
jgi:hypothetical protein